jgi:hypothetical protein
VEEACKRLIVKRTKSIRRRKHGLSHISTATPGRPAQSKTNRDNRKFVVFVNVDWPVWGMTRTHIDFNQKGHDKCTGTVTDILNGYKYFPLEVF